MSYFSTIYSDNSLPVRAKTVYMYLRDRSDKSASAGRESTLLPPSSTAPAPQSNAHFMIWRSMDIYDGCRDTEKAAAVLLICMCL